jgi:glutathione S-transferase
MLKLIVGNKRYSSWSMRPWVALKSTGVPFEEQVIGLDLPETAANIAKVNPAGRVPVLQDGDLTVWDTLAICEYLNEKLPEAQLWPLDARARAVARSACAEMHSGFQALRNDLAMRIYPPQLPVPKCVPGPDAQKDIARITALWTDLRAKFGKGGPYLFGKFSIADAYYAPVAVGRFLSYSVPTAGVVKDYVDAVAAHPAVRAWVADAHAETLRAPKHE